MENKVTSRQYLCFHSKEFPETPHISLQLYCLETVSVWLASAINERQILYFTYIHERGTELRCYIFLFISLHVRLHVCSVIHFVPVHFHVCLARLKGRVGILFHIHSSESTGYVIHSPHIYIYIVSWKYIWVDRMKHFFARFCFAFLFSLNKVWSLIYLLFTINFTLHYIHILLQI